MAKRETVKKGTKVIMEIDPVAPGSNSGWQRFLEVMFPGIEQIQPKKKLWAPIRDFLRIIAWGLVH